MSSEPKMLAEQTRQQLFNRFYMAVFREDRQAMIQVLNEDPTIIDIPNPHSINRNNTALYCAAMGERFDSVEFLILQGAKIDYELLIDLHFWNNPSKTNKAKMLGILIKNVDLRLTFKNKNILNHISCLGFSMAVQNIPEEHALQSFKNIQSVFLLLLNYGIIINADSIEKISSVTNSKPPYTRLLQLVIDASNLLEEVAKENADKEKVQEFIKSLDDYSQTVRREEIQERQKIVDAFGPGDAKSKGEAEHKAKAETELATEKLTKMPLINARNKDGDTAVHLAARNNRDDIVTLLLQHGARTDLENCENKTALQVASQGNHGKVVYLIETHEKEKLGKKEGSSLKNPEKEAGAAALPPKLS